MLTKEIRIFPLLRRFKRIVKTILRTHSLSLGVTFSYVCNFWKLSGYSTWIPCSFTPKILILCYLLSPSPLFLCMFTSILFLILRRLLTFTSSVEKKSEFTILISLSSSRYIFDSLVLSRFLSYSLSISLSVSTNLINYYAYRHTSPAPEASTFYL